MRPILIALNFFLTLLAGPLWAECQGRDLSGALTAAEQTALEARLADMPFSQGNHWRATRNNQVLHVIGTMHLGETRLDGPTMRLGPLIKGADQLLVEMAADEKAKLESTLASRLDMLLLTDTTLPELLPEAQWNVLADAMRQRDIPPFMGAKMQPWYVSLLLAIPPCMKNQLVEANGLDARLEQQAIAADVTVRSLEPFETGFNAFSGMPLDIQMLMVRSALADQGDGEDMFETMLAAYFAEDHGAGQALLEVVSPRLTPLTPTENEIVFRALDEALISARNRAWIPVIQNALDQTDGYVVTAFGAAHLAGHSGVLNLLKQEGFTLERLPF